MSDSYLRCLTVSNYSFLDNTPRSPPPEEIEDMNDAFNAEQEAKAQYYKAKAEKEKADREKVAEEAQVAEEDL